AQVPGGMLTNLESQLKQQNAADKLDQVLAEIPRVREDLGFIPLVTPTSQIVGTQAVLNVLTGERYKTIAKETAGILKGEYGHTPVPVNAALQARVLEGGTPVTAPLAGNIWKVIATEGQTVAEGDVLLILEAMKMETEIRAAQAGTVRGIAVKSGDAVSVGDTLMTLA
ncbi:biotin/lipoyl-binding protein, partial [Salmonella enterica subsp. enterica serovar Saintpaul]|nr:biotin/lipoyl-binding protein [Salmonella enterica subsp. enterica serovar Saintpaul]